jgi:hypothetical protein
VILTRCSFDPSLHCNAYSYMSLLPRSGSWKNLHRLHFTFCNHGCWVCDCCSSYWSRNNALRVMSKISYFIEASCRTWYNFNQFRFRKKVLYFLILRSFMGRTGPPFPPGAALDPLAKSAPPCVESWIRAWYICIYILIFSTMISTLYRVQHTYINLFHDVFHAIA